MRLIDALIRLIPGKQAICQWGAILPIRYRNYLTFRLLAKFARTLAESNPRLRLQCSMGIRDSLRVSLPICAQASYLFGRPQDYRGERCVLFLARHLAIACDAIADIGANWGYHTYYLGVHAPNSPIYSFEPNSALSAQVRQGAADNQLSNVHCINKAIAERSGEVTFYLNTSDDLSSSLTDTFAQGGHRVEITTVSAQSFDEFSANLAHQQWLLKVDVESAESIFLQGAMTSITQGKVRYLIIELLTSARKERFVERLISLGFHAYYLNDLHVEHVLCDDLRSSPGEYNWLFCKASPSQLAEQLQGTAFQVTT